MILIIYSLDFEFVEVIEEIVVVEDDGNSSSDLDDGIMMSMDDVIGILVGFEWFYVLEGELLIFDEVFWFVV